MIWKVCFAASVGVLLLAVVCALTVVRKYRAGRLLRPFHVIFAGIFAAVFIGLIPPLAEMVDRGAGRASGLLLVDLMETLQAFTINVGADLILENIGSAGTGLSRAYSAYMFALFCAAPFLTFGFIISLFQDVLAEFKCRIRFRGDIYAFSELNDRSLALAASIRKKHPRALIVFAGVDRGAEDRRGGREKAKELGAVCFRKEIGAIGLGKYGKRRNLNLFAIDSDERDALLKALKLAERYNERDNTSLYVFAAGTEGELLLANTMNGKLKIRRIDEVRSLIYRFLNDQGSTIFTSALPVAGDCRKITAVILGLGRYGTEMLKALAWYCQMDGYSVEIHAFDRDSLAKERFCAQCPELMSGGTDGEGRYDIRIHADTDVSTKRFADEVSSLTGITFAEVCLGNDRDNVTHAVNLRMLCERNGSKPIIQSVVYNTDETKALADIRNHRGEAYKVEFIGDLASSFSEEVILNQELEDLALARHLKWDDKFWKYDYNYRSSMAAAVHMKARIECGIPGADKREQDLTPEEREGIARLEHRRWNAYMRSEGYVYSGSPDKSSRNDLAKMHNFLIPFDLLPEEEKRKDVRTAVR